MNSSTSASSAPIRRLDNHPRAVGTASTIALALLATLGCGVGPDDAPSQAIEGSESELRGAGPATFDPAGLGIVSISIEHADPSVCTGTLVRNNWVITAKGCLTAAAPANLTIDMWSTHGLPFQQSGATEIYLYPNIDIALIKLAHPFTVGGGSSFVRPLTGSVPVMGTRIRCFGFDSSAGMALKALTYTVTDWSWNFYRVADSGSTLERQDIGTSCILDDGTTLGPIMGVVSSVGTTGVHALTTFIHDTNWVEDMINLSQLADRNFHNSARIQSTFDSMCLDVAWASVWPHVAVNQYHCHDGLNQRWYWSNPEQPWNDTHFQSLVSVNSGKCLEMDDHHHLRQNTCTGASNQIFGRRFFTYGWALTNNGLCADVPGFSTTEGQYIQMYPCNWGRNQGWRSN